MEDFVESHICKLAVCGTIFVYRVPHIELTVPSTFSTTSVRADASSRRDELRCYKLKSRGTRLW